MILPVAWFALWWHCLWGMFSGHQMTRTYPVGARWRTSELSCTCGRVFYERWYR